MYEFLDPRRVNIFFAYLAIAFGLFSVIFAVYEGIAVTNEYFQSLNNGELTMPETSTLYNQQSEQLPMFFTLAGLIGFIVSLLSFLFQSLCNYQWSKVLNRNIYETNRLLSDMMNKTTDQEVLYDFQWMSDKLNALWIQQWAFFGYIIMSLLGTIFNNTAMIFSVFAFVFLAYYLSQIFKVSNELLRIKSQFYSFYLKEKYHEGLEYIIPYRNIIMFFIFSVLTLGIYWYYLLFKLSTEINFFLDYDEKLMIQLPDSPLLKGMIMKIKVMTARFTNGELMNRIEEDYSFFQHNNYAIHDYVDTKGFYILDVYLPETADEKELINHLHQWYPELTHFKIENQNQEDWFEKWKQSLKPIWLTEHFLVDPAMNKSEEVQIIKITPGMAFGTGYHETTRLTAQLLQQYATPGQHLLDLGCGSGILSIMGAQMGCKVTAVDLDPFAIEATHENIRKNSVSSSVTVLASDLLKDVQGTFDIICANILYDILKQLFDQEAAALKRVIRTSTLLIFSGLILKQYESFKGLVDSNGFKIVQKLSEGDWLTLAVRLKNTEVIAS